MMPAPDIYQELLRKFRTWYRREQDVAAYAPGRIEVIGNHTDYNEVFVCSAAIDRVTWFVASRRSDKECRLVAGDLMLQADFCTCCNAPLTVNTWANYVAGVLDGFSQRYELPCGFDGMFFSNIPLGAGLSSSAALEVSAALAFSALYGVSIDRMEIARIAQRAEHNFAGVKCGLLDQITSLYGAKGTVVETDFRSMTVKNIPLGKDAAFLMCNTHVKHALVDGEYNSRREACETARDYFASVLPHPVTALRDVSVSEWHQHKGGLDPIVAQRAVHPISENERVLAAVDSLKVSDLKAFGEFMFASHESSRHNFENSTPELDCLVDAAHKIPGVLGARLSGGGFGGSVIVLVHPRDAETAATAMKNSYKAAFGEPCDVCLVHPSDAAYTLPLPR